MRNSEQLQAMFEKYRDRYWPGRLRRYRVIAGSLISEGGAFGVCICSQSLIIVDVERHMSVYDLRSTLLHEMAHAAAGSRSRGHDSRFLAELEHLLESGARLRMGLPETGNLPLIDSVPDRFPRVKRALTMAYRKERRAVEDLDLPEFEIDETYICDEFRTAGERGLSWKEALSVVGSTYGLTDVDGKLLTTGSKDEASYRKAHRAGRTLWRAIKRRSVPSMGGRTP